MDDSQFLNRSIQILSKLRYLLYNFGFKIKDIKMTDSVKGIELFIDFASFESELAHKHKKHD